MVRILTSGTPVHNFLFSHAGTPVEISLSIFVSVSYIEIFICVYEIIRYYY
jgi:hypothetical protein